MNWNDIFDTAIIGGAKLVLTGSLSPYLFAIVGVAVGTALIEKWLVKRYHKSAAKGVKFVGWAVGGIVAIDALLKGCRYAFIVLR